MPYTSEELFTVDPAVITNQIKAFYNNFLDSTWLPLHSSIDNDLSLFHYTNQSGIEGILKSTSLWYNHASILNDPSEIKYGKSVIKKTIDTLISDTEDELKIKFLKHVLNSPTLGSLHHAYISCFCESGELLSQWRAYSNNGGGYCLRFDINNEANINGVKDDFETSSKFKLRKVIYDIDSQKELVRDAVNGLFDALIESKEEFSTRRFDHLLAVTALSATNILSDMIITFKHSAFKEEHEWRAVRIIRDNYEAEHLKFRSDSKYLIPYREVQLYKGDDNRRVFPISEISFGPNLEFKIAKTGISLLIEHLKSLSDKPIKLPEIINITGTDYRVRND